MCGSNKRVRAVGLLRLVLLREEHRQLPLRKDVVANDESQQPMENQAKSRHEQFLSKNSLVLSGDTFNRGRQSAWTKAVLDDGWVPMDLLSLALGGARPSRVARKEPTRGGFVAMTRNSGASPAGSPAAPPANRRRRRAGGGTLARRLPPSSRRGSKGSR